MHELLPAILAGIITGLVTWGGIRIELIYMRRAINAAHRRLDIIKAPAADLPAVRN